ncbi:SH3 domain-containing protein [Mucilaginibacter yixingensis]|uniref:SH3 domain-containing protein n=1 Tax=Mucilaginibacter yixingensis TaxID=1295612 RepID=A0A2T5JAU4_9SPHI|nr:C40 family peptidase [Mucilaginibacter yixingensis]PTQ97976.1 SH3 domain-containing protein [Mucilaginibacter yixingensis]
MEYGICNLAMAPLRAQPSERAEQVSQILFGEAFEIMEWNGQWARVITAFDGYEGWLNKLLFKTLEQASYQSLIENPATFTIHPVTQARKRTDDSMVYLPFGSSLSFLKGTIVDIADDAFEIMTEIGEQPDFEAIAKSFLNTPYLWGGRTHFGIDCSGFTQAVMRTQNILLKRDAYMQAEQGNTVDFLQEAKLGDLAFFDNDEGRIVHVGIMLNNEQIIHASGKVRIDTIDNQGIYAADQKKYTHKLRIIKRLF